MPLYRYSAYDDAGRLLRDEAEFDNRSALLERLAVRGLRAFEIAEVDAQVEERWWQRDLTAGRGMPLDGLARFSRDLATLLAADVALDDALRIVALQSQTRRLRGFCERVLGKVRDGRPLSAAIAAAGETLPSYYVSILEAGEAGGRLAGVMDDLAALLERSLEVRRQVQGALVYPAILLATALVAVSLIVTVLVPNIAPLFDDLGAPPPPFIAFVLATQSFLAGNAALLVFAFLALLIAVFALSRIEAAKALRDRLALRLPLFGALIADSETARFARTYATLLKSGVPVLQGLRITENLARNRQYVSGLRAVSSDMREGARLGEALSRTKLFSPLALRLAMIGEQTGRLDEMLMHLAELCETRQRRLIDRMVALIAPAMTLIIGLGVGALILSVMQTVLGLSELAIQ